MQNKKGFTLVEIMIVVVIIGLLAIMAIPAFQKVRQTSQTNVVTNNLRQIANAADQYFMETGKSSATWDDLVGANKYITSAPSPVGEEDYKTTFAEINQGYANLTIEVPALGKNVVYTH